MLIPHLGAGTAIGNAFSYPQGPAGLDGLDGKDGKPGLRVSYWAHRLLPPSPRSFFFSESPS